LREQNLSVLGKIIRETNADLYVLPELFTAAFDYLAQNWRPAVAESISNGPTYQQTLAFLRNRSSAVVVCGLVERCGADYYNVAAVVGHGWIEHCRVWSKSRTD